MRMSSIPAAPGPSAVCGIPDPFRQTPPIPKGPAESLPSDHLHSSASTQYVRDPCGVKTMKISTEDQKRVVLTETVARSATRVGLRGLDRRIEHTNFIAQRRF